MDGQRRTRAATSASTRGQHIGVGDQDRCGTRSSETPGNRCPRRSKHRTHLRQPFPHRPRIAQPAPSPAPDRSAEPCRSDLGGHRLHRCRSPSPHSPNTATTGSRTIPRSPPTARPRPDSAPETPHGSAPPTPPTPQSWPSTHPDDQSPGPTTRSWPAPPPPTDPPTQPTGTATHSGGPSEESSSNIHSIVVCASDIDSVKPLSGEDGFARSLPVMTLGLTDALLDCLPIDMSHQRRAGKHRHESPAGADTT